MTTCTTFNCCKTQCSNANNQPVCLTICCSSLTGNEHTQCSSYANYIASQTSFSSYVDLL